MTLVSWTWYEVEKRAVRRDRKLIFLALLKTSWISLCGSVST